ncbi:MAG: LacI family DNA-binding transcriptional regulator [Sulfitobacter sp.]
MYNERITSLQVAKRAGVSQSAVSRVFTPGASASAKTVEKVRRAAKDLGYRPNAMARAMITGKSRMIGLVVAYLENQFYPEAVERLSNALQAKGYHVLMFMASPTAGDGVQKVMEEILDYQVEGIVLASVSMSSDLSRRCADHNIPIVLFNREQDDTHMSSVTTDNYRGGYVIGTHFAELGHKRIGYIAGHEQASTQRDRERGFHDGLEAAGLKIQHRQVGAFVYANARAATLEMCAGTERPDAIFVCNDHMAFAVMDALRYKLGLRVPEDISVAGFDDVPIAAWPAYDLTSYRQPINRMVEQTVTTLMQKIANPAEEAQRVKIEGQLILRGTTAPAKGDADAGL